jgi:putative DNA primase/helicase
MNTILKAALSCGKVGMYVVPCDPADKHPCGTLVPQDLGPNGKRIKGTGGLKKASCDSAKILEWFTLRPEAMIGIRTGEI